MIQKYNHTYLYKKGEMNMFIRDCLQTFMMDGKEVVILLHKQESNFFGYETKCYTDLYAIPVEVANELMLDEYDDMAFDDGTLNRKELLNRIEKFKLYRKESKKLPYVFIEDEDDDEDEEE